MFYRFLLVLILALSCEAVLGAETDSLDTGTVESENADLVKADSVHASGITRFRRKFLVRFLCNYNFVTFWSSENKGDFLVSNRPVDVGLGIGYGDFYWDFIYALPFTADTKSKSAAFELGFDFFPGNWWIKGKYRRTSGFTLNDSASTFIDFWERDAYISALWMGTAKGEFSPLAAYFLDRKQARSAGSLIIGGRVQSNWAKDYSKSLDYYAEDKRLVTDWLNMGYSYTWIYSNHMFLNLWGVAGSAIGVEYESKEFLFTFDVVAKMAWGYIGETWSWNCVMEAEYLPMFFEDHGEQKWVSAFKILVVRRF